MYYYQHSATCFGVCCAIFRENFFVCSKLLLHCLVTNLKLYFTWVYIFIYKYLKNQIWFLNNVRCLTKQCNNSLEHRVNFSLWMAQQAPETCISVLIIIHLFYRICALCWYITDIIIVRKIHGIENFNIVYCVTQNQIFSL